MLLLNVVNFAFWSLFKFYIQVSEIKFSQDISSPMHIPSVIFSDI
jgi:hypothetical protein